MMKKNILFQTMIVLLSVATLSLISCKKDDDTGPTGPGELELAALNEVAGTWQQTAITQDGKEPQFDITTSPVLVIESDTETGENNTYSVTNGHYVLPDASGAAWSFVTGTSFNSMSLEGFVVTRSNSGTTMTLTRIVDEEIGPGATSGRGATIGTYEMTFEKQ